LLIQFRSYLNYSMTDHEVTVVTIPYRDINSARSGRERGRVLDQEGTTEQTRHLVELELAGDLTSLSTALADEFARPATRKKKLVWIHIDSLQTLSGTFVLFTISRD